MGDESYLLSQVQINLSLGSSQKQRNRSLSDNSIQKAEFRPRSNSVKSKSNSLDHTSSYPALLGNSEKPNSETISCRVYEIWPGQNRFCCKGKCIFGRASDCKYILITWGIILIFTILYCVIIVPTLITSKTLFIPIFSGVFFLLTIIFFLLTSLSDPGIIPRKEMFELFGPVPEQYTLKIIEEYLKQDLMPTIDKLNELHRTFKFCTTCRIHRPPRASHCTYCDNCIEVFDHHCSFIGNCVGKRNYRYFVAFLMFLVLYGLSVILGFIFTILVKDGSYKVIRNSTVLKVIIIVMSATLLVPLLWAIILLMRHLYMLCK